ncbi:Uncharacterised protein [Yersinia frederiksenii]|nr:Uncharacterised protein [Yersinia frederiksenii]
MCLGGFRLAMIVSVELNADNLTLCAESFSDKCAVLRRINAAKTLRRSGKNRFPKVMGVAARQQGAHPDELT